MGAVVVNAEWRSDSSPNGFRTACMQAVSKLGMKANPVLMEPIMNLEISVDEQYLGNILADLTKIRGTPFLSSFPVVSSSH